MHLPISSAPLSYLLSKHNNKMPMTSKQIIHSSSAAVIKKVKTKTRICTEYIKSILRTFDFFLSIKKGVQNGPQQIDSITAVKM